MTINLSKRVGAIDNTMKASREKAKRAKNFWYAWHPKDYAAKTSTLTLAEDGAYRRLLDHYYLMDGVVVANATLLLRVCRALDEAEKAAVLSVLGQFFVERDGYYRHERADVELEKRAELREKRAAAGSKGGKQKVANATNLLAVSHDVCQTQSQSQSQSHKKETEAKASEGKPSASPVPQAASPLDLQKELWGRGVSYLKANGASDSHARSLIGKWRKQLGGANAGGDFAVLQLLAKAEAETVAEPVAFIEAHIIAKGKPNGRPNGRDQGQPRAAFDVFAEAYLDARAERERLEREAARH